MSRCGAEEFRRDGGPSAVPLRICCVAALIRAGSDPVVEAPPGRTGSRPADPPFRCVARLVAAAVPVAESVIAGASDRPS